MNKNKKSNSKLQLGPKMQQEEKKKFISPSSIDSNMSKMKKITLSSQLEINIRVQQQEVQKISLVHKSITIFDRICNSQSHQFKSEKIRFLYLSNNFISDIEHIQQFTNLQTLSLSYNQIMKLTNIRYLSVLSKLSHLALEGNPISKSPFYFPYIVGVTSINSHGNVLKKVDKMNAEYEWRRENIKNWDVYEQSMGEMIRNYMKLIYMMQLWKKMSFHRVITIANAQISRYNCRKQIGVQNESRLSYKVDFYLAQAEQEIKQLPTKYIMNIQSTIYEDINRISTRRLQLHENEGQGYNSQEQQSLRSQKIPMLQVYVASMYELLQRQKQKIAEIKQKMLAKYAYTFSDSQHISFQSQFSTSEIPRQRQSYNQFLSSFYAKTLEEKQLELNEGQKNDIQKVQQLLEYSLHSRCEKSKESMYYEWKLIAKIFNRFKLYSEKVNKMKYSALTITRILNNKTSEKFRMGISKIKEMRKIKMMEGVVETMRKKMKNVLETCFQLILENCNRKKEQVKEEGIQQKHRQILQNKRKQRKIWKAWKELTYNLKIIKQNKQLKEQIFNYQIRQQKLTSKLHLLEKLLEVTEKKLNQKQMRQNDPKWLFNQIEKDCQQLRSRSPSPKSLIRKNKCLRDQNDDDRQLSTDKENNQLRNNLIFQRKFNSSQKYLTIDKSNY